MRFKPEYDVYGAGSMNVRTPLNNLINCTGGFIVTNGTARGISTAGHCHQDGYYVESHWGQPVGQFMGAEYRKGTKGLDVAWYRNSTYTYLNRVRISPTSFYTISATGPLIPASATPICIIKRNQTQLCATVQTYYYLQAPDGTWTNGPYIQVDRDLAVGGDSGGPWLYGGTAYGIHWG